MTSLALQHDAFSPRRPAGMRAGLVLALLAHLLLIAALTWSVRWHASEPEGVVAELWSATPQIAAPRAATAEPPPPPPARAEPKPAPAVPRVVEPPRETRADAQIAVERAAQAKARRDEAAREEAARQAELAKKQAKREEAQRVESAKREQQKAEEIAQAKAAQAAARQDEKRLAAIREANIKRAMSQAGSSDEATTATSGTAPRTSGPSASYAGRIKARIKPNIVFTANVTGNPLATVEVRCAPDGTIVGKKLTKSSGSPAWDEAVLRAIDKTEVLPKDTDGRVPASFTIDFRPFE